MPREKTEIEMDLGEAAQLLKWLEEERRQDKALLADLQKRQEQHEGQLVRAWEATERLEQNLARAAAEVSHLSRFDKALQQFKDEILMELRKSEERDGKEHEARDRQLREERQERVSGLARLEQRLTEAMKIQEPLDTQRAEIQRLTKTASALRLQIDEAAKEVRGQQEKFLAVGERVSKVEQSMVELFQASEEEQSRSGSMGERLTLVQALLEREDQRMGELAALVEDTKGEQSQLADQLRGVVDRGKKQISGWAKEMAAWRTDAEAVREQIGLSDKQLRTSERMLDALDALRIQLEKDRDALQHMERTAEERQRQQLEEWRKENELLWLGNRQQWEQLADENDKRDEYIALLWEVQVAYLRREMGELDKLTKELERRLMRPNR